MSGYEIGRRDTTKENKWESIDINNFHIHGPTVICFGGRGTIMPRHANYLCRLAGSLMGNNDEKCSIDIDFWGVVHGRDENGEPVSRLTVSDEREIAEKLSTALCTSGGHVLPDEDIIRNFNNITFFTHCQGASELNDVIGFIRENMIRLGISPVCIAKAMGQMFAVNYAPLEFCDIPSLNIISMKDRTLREHFAGSGADDTLSKKIFNILNASNAGQGNVIIKDDENNATLICSNLTLDGETENIEHRITFLDRDAEWDSSVFDISRHGDHVSQIAGYALAMSVASGIKNSISTTFSPKPTIDQFISDARDIMADSESGAFRAIVDSVRGTGSGNPTDDDTSGIV